jgi:NAD(P)-dependent dehydrogenase (short-subunit alcohol dehydrogenase family)
MELESRTAVVTGGASGIGRAIALAYAEEGARIAIGDVRADPREDADATPTHELIRERGGEAVFHETDVTDGDAARSLVEATHAEFGGVDVLVNNAGLSKRGEIEALDPADWQEIVDTNLTSVYHCSKAALPSLRESDAPRVVNVASQLGIVGTHDGAAYCAAKGGVVNLTRQMAVQYADDEITVNALCPGPVKTSMVAPQLESDDEFRAYVEERTLLPFVGEPEDVAHAAVFLASEGARYVTGHALVVDGGWTAR